MAELRRVKDKELKEKDNELTELRRKMDVEMAQLRAAKESAERDAAKEAERADKAEARAEKSELTELRRKMDVEIAQLKAAKESAEREAAKEAEHRCRVIRPFEMRRRQPAAFVVP